VSLTSPAINFGDTTAVELRFFHRYAMESGYDYGYVEYSTDDGASWHTVTSYSGNLSSWQEAAFALPSLDGATDARIRFRLTSDSSVTGDGWHIDDISLTGVQAFPGFADGFESGDTSAWSATVP
jgi:bacillopeptidase F